MPVIDLPRNLRKLANCLIGLANNQARITAKTLISQLVITESGSLLLFID